MCAAVCVGVRVSGCASVYEPVCVSVPLCVCVAGCPVGAVYLKDDIPKQIIGSQGVTVFSQHLKRFKGNNSQERLLMTRFKFSVDKFSDFEVQLQKTKTKCLYENQNQQLTREQRPGQLSKLPLRRNQNLRVSSLLFFFFKVGYCFTKK